MMKKIAFLLLSLYSMSSWASSGEPLYCHFSVTTLAPNVAATGTFNVTDEKIVRLKSEDIEKSLATSGSLVTQMNSKGRNFMVIFRKLGKEGANSKFDLTLYATDLIDEKADPIEIDQAQMNWKLVAHKVSQKEEFGNRDVSNVYLIENLAQESGIQHRIWMNCQEANIVNTPYRNMKEFISDKVQIMGGS